MQINDLIGQFGEVISASLAILVVRKIEHSRLRLTILACTPSNHCGSPVSFKLHRYPTAASVMQYAL
jgi:hypothetical protein